MASGGPGVQLRLRQLKKDVLHVLSNHPGGVQKKVLWNTVTNEIGRKISRKDYNLPRMTDVLGQWEDDIEEVNTANGPVIRIRQKLGGASGKQGHRDKDKPPSLDSTNDFPSLESLKQSNLESELKKKEESKHGAKSKPTSAGASKQVTKTVTDLTKTVTHLQSKTDTGLQTETDTVLQLVTEGAAALSREKTKDKSIFDMEVRRTVVEVFAKLGCCNSITLNVLWKLVCDELNEIPMDEFKKFLETCRDIVELDIPAGPTKADETYRLKKDIVKRLQEGVPISRIFNQQTHSDGESRPPESENQVGFNNKFGKFIRDLLKFYPDGCSVNVILQNVELQKNFPAVGSMSPLEVQRLLGNIKGVFFDGTLCMLSVSYEIARRIQIISLRLIQNGNFSGVTLPYLAQFIRNSDVSFIGLQDKQIFYVIETTCVPNILVRNGDVYYRVPNVNLDRVIMDLVTENSVSAENRASPDQTATAEKEDSDEESEEDDSNTPTLGQEELASLKQCLCEILENYPTGLKYKNLRRRVKFLGINFSKKDLDKSCKDVVNKKGKSYRLRRQNKPTAMEIMSRFSGWGQGAGANNTAQSHDSVIDLTSDTPERGTKQKQVLKQDFISFDMDSPKTIDLTDDATEKRHSPSPSSQSYHGIGNMPLRLQGPGLQYQPGIMPQRPGLMGQAIPSLMSGLQKPTFGPGPLPGMAQNKHQSITAMDCTPVRNNASLQGAVNNPFMERDSAGLGPGFRDVVVDLTVQPVIKKEFETKEIISQPVYVPRGQRPSPDMVESIAKECIEALADANEFVSPERVEKLLLQRFGVHSVRVLGFPFADKITCINEANRMICKINAYIYAFVKTRSMCTLYELRECLREFVPNKEDFSKLKLGPIQRFPVVFEQFRFPPDQEIIPEIHSTDLLEHFRNYMSKKNLWTSRLELEDFMNYLVEVFSADNAYYLGVRIRSLPLAAQVLKKAQRDAGNSRREIIEHFKQNVRSEIEDAFRKFRASVLEAGEGEGLEVRKHYLKLRPEIAITEIFEKFNLLLTFDQPTNRSEKRHRNRISSAVEEFISAVKQDSLARSLLHLAMCITNTVLEESAMELLAPGDKQENTEQSQQKESKPPPRKETLLESFKKYVERCVNAGALSLNHLGRIEEKLLEDFGFDVFHAMGYGRFLEFILHEAKQVLEESGGLTLGSSSGSSDSDVGFKPQQADLFEFIKQANQCGISQPGQLEEALCHQYGMKDVKFLGHGNINRLLSAAEKHKKHQHTDFTVHYETALVAKTGLPPVTVSKVGMLGHQSKDAAKICLHNCPLLEDMAEWSQWTLIFEPEHGKLKDFIQKYGGVTTMSLEGGRIAHIDMVALETKPGHLIKIAGNTSTEHFAAALNVKDVTSTCGHLVSLAVSSKGTENMPLALLAVHLKTALIQMHAADQQTDTPGGPPSVEVRGSKAAEFVLKCLVKIPTKICVALANKLFLDPLGQAVGSTKSKQLLLQMCTSVNDMNHLLELGCLLGISEWTNIITPKCRLPDVAVQSLPPDIEEFFETEEQDEESESETESESSEETDVDLSDDDEESQEPDVSLTTEVDKKKVTEESKSTGEEESEVDEVKDEESETEEVDDVAMVTIDSVDSSDDDGDSTSDVTEIVDPCRSVVDQIRKDEFGIGVVLSEDGQRLMKVQQERLGRSIDRLSKDLYSKDTHFVLELVQNADDNSYHDDLLNESTDDCPSVKFVIDSSKIMVLNNEQGFQEQNIRYLCDVGRSTKGKHKYGYIGQKGIGFKSVFRVTDTPEVHSNGYHIKFDVNSGPMGYILPHWLEEEPDDGEAWMTKIILPLKETMRLQTRTLAARFHDIHPSLLLFLHRLREITIENKVEGGVQRMRRHDLGDDVVEIKHSDGSDRWLVVKKMLDASKISLQAKSGVDVESTEIALAFPLKPQGQSALSQVLPPKQKVFAFLPLRSYGFRFIVQGDFDVPSSREDVDRDSSWNQWLRNEIHTLFIESLEVFKVHPDFSNMEAVSGFLQFVPMEDEILDFFKPVATQILSKLKARPCIPTQPNSQGVISWKIPSQTVRVRDPLVREVITPELLQKHLNLFYLHGDVAAMLNPTLTSCLGIESLTSEHLFQLGKAMIVDMGSHCSDEDVVTISRWLACMYRSLDEFQHDETVLDSLKAFQMLPLSDGELVSLNEKTVFFPILKNSDRLRNRDPIFYLQQDVSSLHPLLLQTDDSEVNSQVQKLLPRLGIKQLSPMDIINHHILPVLKSDQWKKKSRPVLISYLIYIKEQTDKKASLCNLDDLKDVAQVVTNNELKNPSREPVHFTRLYGNRIDLPKMFSGYGWVLLDACYPSDVQNPLLVRGWHEFFAKLGVEDFISIKAKDEHLTKTTIDNGWVIMKDCVQWKLVYSWKDPYLCLQLERSIPQAQSPWKSFEKIWPPLDEYIVKDYYSPELEALIKDNKNQSGDSYAFQMRNLCIQMDQMWEGRFSRYITTQVMDKDGKPLRETDTSFSLLLRTSAWLPAIQTKSEATLNGGVSLEKAILMKQPSALYIRSEIVEKYLSHKVLYLDVTLSMNTFYQFLGLKNSVTIETVKEYLLEWCERDKTEEPAKFCTSLSHMKSIYLYLSNELKRQEFQDLLREKAVYFVPDRVASKISQDVGMEVSGKMLNRNEIWLEDPTRLFDKYRTLLEEFHSEICRKRTILLFYRDTPNIVELFKQEGKLDIAPKVEEYLELLNLLCTTTTPKENEPFADILCIFTTIGHAMVTPPSGMPDEQTANMALESLKQMVRRKVEKQKVFPTKKRTWVSLEDRPMIGDNKEFEKMFVSKTGVHFLDLEDRSRPHQGGFAQRRILSRHQDHHIHPDHINVFIEVCGVKKLSDCVKTEVAPEMIQPCLQLQLYFHNIIPAVQRFMIVRFREIYEDLAEANTKAMLADAKFYQAAKLDVTYRLSNLKEDTFEVRPEKCVISPPIFYFHKDHLNSASDINHEIARHFSGKDSNCYALLRSFLTELSNILNNTANDTIVELLQRYNADQLQIPEEELWVVEAPIMPEPEPEPEPELEEQLPAADKSNKTDDSEFQLRSWPPCATNPNTSKPRKETKEERPVSNIWPPPKSKDYMKSVRDLPSNVKIGEGKKEENQSDGAKLPDDKGDNAKGEGVERREPDTRKRKLSENQSSEQEVKRLSSGEEKSGQTIMRGQSQSQVQGQGLPNVRSQVGAQQGTDEGQQIRDEINMRTGGPPGQPQASETQDRQEAQKCVPSEHQGGPARSVATIDEGQEPRDSDEGPHADGQTPQTDGRRKRYAYRDVFSPSSPKKQAPLPTELGDPVWTHLASDYTYDELGHGGDLPLPEEVSLEDGDGVAEVGYWGELLVYQYLLAQKAVGNIIDVHWSNQDGEKGNPYDFEVHFADDNGMHVDYIEVKSTMSESKEVFQISVQQIKFADEKKENFHIYRVFNAGNPEKVRLIRIHDLNMRLSQKQVQLCMMI